VTCGSGVGAAGFGGVGTGGGVCCTGVGSG